VKGVAARNTFKEIKRLESSSIAFSLASAIALQLNSNASRAQRQKKT